MGTLIKTSYIILRAVFKPDSNKVDVPMENRNISYTCWKCQYHIVFIPEYRKRILYGKIRDNVREIISTLCKYKNGKIVAGTVYIDYVQLSGIIPTKLSISNFRGYIKRKVL